MMVAEIISTIVPVLTAAIVMNVVAVQEEAAVSYTHLFYQKDRP